MKSSQRPGYALSICCMLTFAVLTVMHAQSTKPVVILVGPPAAGKSTQADLIQKQYGFSLITREQLLHDDPSILARHEDRGGVTVEPRVDPALNDLFLNRLEKTNVRKGLLLDGYPASKNHGDFLQKVLQERGFKRPRVLKFELPDDVVRERLKGQDVAQIEQDLKDYHREMDYVTAYFPEADVVKIDAGKKEKAVFDQIHKSIDEYLKKP
jgi:adenylate kinase family enzyme